MSWHKKTRQTVTVVGPYMDSCFRRLTPAGPIAVNVVRKRLRMDHNSPRNGFSSGTSASRTSTPPTEPLSGRSSPEFVLPPETEETRQRRAQSDRASSAIGNLMLKGWAMLGDECPNDACYGIPLVRPPKQGGIISPTSVSTMKLMIARWK